MEEYFCPLGKDFGGGRVCLFFCLEWKRLLGSCSLLAYSNCADFGKHALSSSPPAMSLLCYNSSSERFPGGMLQPHATPVCKISDSET